MNDGQEKPVSAEDAIFKAMRALKEAVLKAALKDAAFDGFTDNVLAKAGKEAGADQAALARLFPEGPLSLDRIFLDLD